jgi:hypothetical protein
MKMADRSPIGNRWVDIMHAFAEIYRPVAALANTFERLKPLIENQQVASCDQNVFDQLQQLAAILKSRPALGFALSLKRACDLAAMLELGRQAEGKK